jgi:ADP-ribose pyrophosphatase YjhB (NUDIX family)
VHRSPEKYPGIKDGWDIVGGRIIPGTGLMENLAREVSEETGLKIIGAPKLIAAQDIIPHENMHVVRLTYVGQCEGEVVLDRQEHDMYEWKAFEELQATENLDIYFKELLENTSLWNMISGSL